MARTLGIFCLLVTTLVDSALAKGGPVMTGSTSSEAPSYKPTSISASYGPSVSESSSCNKTVKVPFPGGCTQTVYPVTNIHFMDCQGCDEVVTSTGSYLGMRTKCLGGFKTATAVVPTTVTSCAASMTAGATTISSGLSLGSTSSEAPSPSYKPTSISASYGPIISEVPSCITTVLDSCHYGCDETVYPLTSTMSVDCHGCDMVVPIPDKMCFMEKYVCPLEVATIAASVPTTVTSCSKSILAAMATDREHTIISGSSFTARESTKESNLPYALY